MFVNDLVETTDIFGLATYIKNGLSLTINNLKVRMVPGKEISIAKVKFQGSIRNSKTQFHNFSMTIHDQ